MLYLLSRPFGGDGVTDKEARAHVQQFIHNPIRISSMRQRLAGDRSAFVIDLVERVGKKQCTIGGTRCFTYAASPWITYHAALNNN
jgi:hypothetical protein